MEAKTAIAEVGHYRVSDDNGAALVIRDTRTGGYYELLSDQDVYFVSDTDDPAAVQMEVLRQIRLRDEVTLSTNQVQHSLHFYIHWYLPFSQSE